MYHKLNQNEDQWLESICRTYFIFLPLYLFHKKKKNSDIDRFPQSSAALIYIPTNISP